MERPEQDAAAARLRNVLEAVLMASDRPLPEQVLEILLADPPAPAPTREQLRAALEELREAYAARGVHLCRVAGGYRFQVGADYAPWVRRLEHTRPPRYSRAVLETLAIIAYRQPVTRGEIERIRGVSVGTGVLRTLLERSWVRVVGHKDVPGRPELLATTREFLDYFNLRSLHELPELPPAPELPEALTLPLPADDGGGAEQDSAAEPAVDVSVEQAVAPPDPTVAGPEVPPPGITEQECARSESGAAD